MDDMDEDISKKKPEPVTKLNNFKIGKQYYPIITRLSMEERWENVSKFRRILSHYIHQLYSRSHSHPRHRIEDELEL